MSYRALYCIICMHTCIRKLNGINNTKPYLYSYIKKAELKNMKAKFFL